MSVIVPFAVEHLKSYGKPLMNVRCSIPPLNIDFFSQDFLRLVTSMPSKQSISSVACLPCLDLPSCCRLRRASYGPACRDGSGTALVSGSSLWPPVCG